MNISWTWNDHTINNLYGISIGSMNQRNSILTIESAEAHNSGEYSCLASNAAGSIKYSSHLNVNGTEGLFS